MTNKEGLTTGQKRRLTMIDKWRLPGMTGEEAVENYNQKMRAMGSKGGSKEVPKGWAMTKKTGQ